MRPAPTPSTMPALLLLGWAATSAPQAFAQDASIVPEIRKELAGAKDDTARADALARLCFNLIRSAPDSALAAGKEALAIAIRTQAPKALGDASNNLGWLAVEQGQFKRADTLLGKALIQFRKIGKPEYTAVVLSNMGWLAAKKGDDATAVLRFQEAFQESETAQDSASMAVLMYALGSTNRKLKDFSKAEEYLTGALAMERVLGRTANAANCLLALANTAREQGDTARIMHLYEQAFALYVRLHDHPGAGLVEENIGDFRMDQSPQQALDHYRIALAHYDTIGSNSDKAYVLKNIGIAQTKLGHLVNAEKSLAQGQELARSIGAAQLVMEYELALAELAAAQGNAARTLGHYARYTALKDSLQGEGTQQEIARLRTAFETERKERDNAMLRVENKAQEQQLHNRELLLYGSALLALLAIIAALLFRRNYRQKRKYAEVLESLNAKLGASHAEIEEINGLLEMKLLRSQMNPHFIYNSLNSAARMTQEGRHAEALAYLQGFARLLRTVLDHSVKDQVSLAEEMDFLRQYLQLESQRLQGLSHSVEAADDLDLEEVDIPALLVQPFVENAVWHGLSNKTGDRSVQVRFSRNGNDLCCEITDNGVGRQAASPAQQEGHHSLGMQLTGERLRLLARRMGGEQSIAVEDLQDGAGDSIGTKVRIKLPGALSD